MLLRQPVEILPDAAKTSAYTELVPLDDRNLLCIYDTIPHGWEPIPDSSQERNRIWVVRLTMDRAAR